MANMDVQPEKPNHKNIVLLHSNIYKGVYWETTIRELLQDGFLTLKHLSDFIPKKI